MNNKIGISNAKNLSVEKAKMLHNQFPSEIPEFLCYLQLYIKYFGNKHLLNGTNSNDDTQKFTLYTQQRLIDCLHAHQDLMGRNALAFSYMLFQPSSALFIEDCILSYITHSDCSQKFKQFVYSHFSELR